MTTAMTSGRPSTDGSDDSKGASIAATVRVLAGYQKSSKGAPAYSRFVNRPLGRWFAATAYHLGLTPNQVTLISAATTYSGIAALVAFGPSLAGAVVVTLALVVGYALDSADGQLARLRGGGSPAGEWLDHVVDAVKISALHIALAVAFYRHGLDERLLLLPLAFTVVANLYFFAYLLGDLLKRSKGVTPRKSGEPASVLRSLLVMPTDYGFLCLLFVTFAWPAVFLTGYTIMLAGTAGYVALGLPKWYRDMQALA